MSGTGRTDTTVVGPIQQGEQFFASIMVSRSGTQDIAIACIRNSDNSNNKQIYFVQSSVYTMITNGWNELGYTPVILQGIRETSGSYMFMALNGLSANNLLGSIVTVNNNLTLNSTGNIPTNYVLNPTTTAVEYPTNLLLTSVTYQIYSVSGTTISKQLIRNTSVDNTMNLGGLARGAMSSSVASSLPLLFIPINYFIRGNCNMKSMTGGSPTQVFTSVVSMQCVQAPGTNFKSGTNCNPLNTGFTRQDECNQGGNLYSYCSSDSGITGGYCSSMVVYNNLNGMATTSPSCRGWCREGTCVTTSSNNNTNSCVMTQTSFSTQSVVPVWTWLIIGFLVLLIIAMVVITLYFAFRTKSHKH